jgi:hypothetical protein
MPVQDEWGEENRPGLSWKHAKVGDFIEFRVDGPMKVVNRKDLEGKSKDGIARYDDGNPMRASVFPVTVTKVSREWLRDEEDEELGVAQAPGDPETAERACFLNKPSQPFSELKKIAVKLRKERGWPLDSGDVVRMKLVKIDKPTQKGRSGQKFYEFELLHAATTLDNEEDPLADDD